MREPTVASVMTRDVVTVRLDTPFKEVARVLAGRGISAVPVVDGDDVVGVVSEADLLAKQEYRSGSVPTPSVFAGHNRKERWRKAFGSTASHVMTKPVVVIDSGAPVVEAVRLLTQADVRRLFVVDRAGVLVGVLARRDLLRLYLRDDDDLKNDIREQVFRQVLSIDPSTIEVVVDGGQVRLAGELDRCSQTTTAIKLVRVMPGVVDVRSELAYRVDDELARR